MTLLILFFSLDRPGEADDQQLIFPFHFCQWMWLLRPLSLPFHFSITRCNYTTLARTSPHTFPPISSHFATTLEKIIVNSHLERLGFPCFEIFPVPPFHNIIPCPESTIVRDLGNKIYILSIIR